MELNLCDFIFKHYICVASREILYFEFHFSSNLCIYDNSLRIFHSEQKVCKMSGWKPGDQQYIDMEALFNTIWEKLNKTANDDGDEEISEEEWVRIFHRFFENKENYMYKAVIFIEMKGEYLMMRGNYVNCNLKFKTRCGWKF